MRWPFVIGFFCLVVYVSLSRHHQIDRTDGSYSVQQHLDTTNLGMRRAASARNNISISSGLLGSGSRSENFGRFGYADHPELLELHPKENFLESNDDFGNGSFLLEDESEGDLHDMAEDGEETKKIVLVTYFRGGSTFLGELFNQNRKVFYWFEPLAAHLTAYKKAKQSSDYLIEDGGNAVSRPTEFVVTLLHTIANILTCKIDDVEYDVKKHYFATVWTKSQKFAKYRQCIRRYKIRHRDADVQPMVVERCQRHLSRACRRSDVRVIKSIRLFVEEIVPLARLDPELKLIYYVRDPRGILLSRVSLSKRPLSEIPLAKFDQAAAYLCAKLRTDLKAAARYRALYPDQILIVRYEDLATRPLETLTDVYGFARLDVPDAVASWIKHATHASKSEGILGTSRTNGSAVATRWQHELSPLQQHVIGERCDDVIDLFYSMTYGSRWKYGR